MKRFKAHLDINVDNKLDWKSVIEKNIEADQIRGDACLV